MEICTLTLCRWVSRSTEKRLLVDRSEINLDGSPERLGSLDLLKIRGALVGDSHVGVILQY